MVTVKWNYFVALLIVFAVSSARGDDKHPEVCARCGCVTGRTREGIGRPYESFEGLPYARPPTQRYRFAAPRALPYWGPTYNGTYPRSHCIQINPFRGDQNEVTGDEDCLFLNVFRPALRKRSLLPVMVYLHGGAFRFGDADPTNLGADYFMETDVVLVTIQFRLNIFGFLSSGDENCPGNFGLKDQAQALRWIRRNIQSFGGDPKSVTLMGHSSGAAAVHLHMMSEGSNDLFHRGIALSGSGIADWAFDVNPLKMFNQQIEFTGLSKAATANTRTAVRELRKLDAKKLFSDSLKFTSEFDKWTVFKPTIEPRGAGAFMTDNPKLIWEKGAYKQRPFLMSFVPAEGGLMAGLFKSQESLNAVNSNMDKILEIGLELKPENVLKVKERYLSGIEKVSMDDAKAVLQMVGDRNFNYPFAKTVSQYVSYANTTENPIYLMKFDFKGPYSYANLYKAQGDMGIIHGDDLFYYFTKPQWVAPFPKSSLDGKMAHILVQTVVNFATTDAIQMWQSFEPCSKDIKTEFCDYQVFQRYTKSEPNRILISVRNTLDGDMIKFWDEIVDNNFQ